MHTLWAEENKASTDIIHFSPFRRAIVEVADFNFGDVGSDMEYKSFRQRLVESVHEAVNEVRQNRSGVPTDLTGDTSVGYGSMK